MIGFNLQDKTYLFWDYADETIFRIPTQSASAVVYEEDSWEGYQ